MAIIPNDEQFVGVSSGVDMTERKSSRLNNTTQVYTLQDFSDSLTPDLTPITVDGNSVSIASDPTAITQSTAVIQSSTLNSGIAIVPNGTGAITRLVPDGTNASGNARGNYAVDFGIPNNGSSKVASGNYSFNHGFRNTASGDFSFAFGRENTASGNGAIAISSYINTATRTGSTAIGGSQNNATSDNSTVIGGQNNTASTNTHATVVGGYANVSSGQYSI